jgi:hypothetical protein
MQTINFKLIEDQTLYESTKNEGLKSIRKLH